MSALCGLFPTAPNVGHSDALRAMLPAGAPFAHLTLKTSQSALLAVLEQQDRSALYEQDGFSLAVVGHPRITTNGARSADLQGLARELRARGSRALVDIGGDFALATWDSRASRGILAVDRIGVRPLAYAHRGDALVFGSTLDSIVAHPGMRKELSGQSIFDYLFFHVCPGPATIYKGIQRLPAGHCIEFDERGAGEPKAYWSMRFAEARDASSPSLKDEFVRLLEGAVADARSDTHCGAFLSGGTDSSTVAGMLARAERGPAQVFSIGFDVPGYDEMEYARIAAAHFGCHHYKYYVTPQDVVDAVPKIAAHYDQPFGNASAIPTYYCAKLAVESGVPHLLAGDGGDELFGGNERYAKQHLLSLYHRVPSALRRALVEPLVASMPGTARMPLLRKIESYIAQARPQMPARYQSYNLLLHLGVDRVLSGDFLSTVHPGHPQILMSQAHAPFAEASLINQMLGIDLRFTLADSDLPKVTQMCTLAGSDVSFPLLDERIVEFSGQLPAQFKLRGQKLRWFFKNALNDFLPPAVISKHKHGFGLPVGAWLVGHKPLRDLAADSIALLRSRRIVRPEFIDELFSARLQEHSAYFGTMVWILMMLGLWLDSRRL